MHFQLMGLFPFLPFFCLKFINSEKAKKCYWKSPAFLELLSGRSFQTFVVFLELVKMLVLQNQVENKEQNPFGENILANRNSKLGKACHEQLHNLKKIRISILIHCASSSW